MENKYTFNYTYSAPQNQEVLAIRQRYLPKQESKLEELKRLDRSARNSGVTEGLILGVSGCMVFGLGMCLALGAVGGGMFLGVALGVLGTAMMIPAYPVYRAVSRRVKANLTPRILQLAEELTGEKNGN